MMAAKAASDKEAADASVAKKVTNDTTMAAMKATIDKEDVAAAKKATDDATVMRGVGGDHRGIGRSRHHNYSGGGDQEAYCAEWFHSACQTAVLWLLEDSVCQASNNMIALLI
jgi:hypothetical protein